MIKFFLHFISIFCFWLNWDRWWRTNYIAYLWSHLNIMCEIRTVPRNPSNERKSRFFQVTTVSCVYQPTYLLFLSATLLQCFYQYNLSQSWSERDSTWSVENWHSLKLFCMLSGCCSTFWLVQLFSSSKNFGTRPYMKTHSEHSNFMAVISASVAIACKKIFIQKLIWNSFRLHNQRLRNPSFHLLVLNRLVQLLSCPWGSEVHS